MRTYIHTYFDGSEQVLLQDVLRVALQHHDEVAVGCRDHQVQDRLLQILPCRIDNHFIIDLAYSVIGKYFFGLITWKFEHAFEPEFRVMRAMCRGCNSQYVTWYVNLGMRFFKILLHQIYV